MKQQPLKTQKKERNKLIESFAVIRPCGGLRGKKKGNMLCHYKAFRGFITIWVSSVVVKTLAVEFRDTIRAHSHLPCLVYLIRAVPGSDLLSWSASKPGTLVVVQDLDSIVVLVSFQTEKGGWVDEATALLVPTISGTT